MLFVALHYPRLVPCERDQTGTKLIFAKRGTLVSLGCPGKYVTNAPDGSGTEMGRSWDGSGTKMGRKWDEDGTKSDNGLQRGCPLAVRRF